MFILQQSYLNWYTFLNAEYKAKHYLYLLAYKYILLLNRDVHT